MATITLPTNGQAGWGTILNAAVNAINAQLETLVPTANSSVRVTDSTGALINMGYSNTATANTIARRDGAAQVLVATTPTGTQHATSKSYVDAQIATRVATSTLSKTATADSTAQRNTDGTLVVATPTDPTHATTKAYVDSAVAGGGGGGGGVPAVSTANVVYVTDSAGAQSTIAYMSSGTANTIARRDSSGQIAVAATPTATSHATSKSYVDGQIALQATLPTTAFSVPATAAVGVQTSLPYSQSATGNTLAWRDGAGNVLVAATPTASGQATSKQYVDAQIALQAVIPTTANRIVGSGATAGVQQNYIFAQSATADSLVQRSSSGQVAVTTPTVDGNAANKGYVDTAIAGVLDDTYNVIASGGTYPAVPASPPNSAIKLRHFYGPTQPAVATWTGVLDLYTVTD